jgi:hypothetical protein
MHFCSHTKAYSSSKVKNKKPCFPLVCKKYFNILRYCVALLKGNLQASLFLSLH